jgi:acylglycerol lipase
MTTSFASCYLEAHDGVQLYCPSYTGENSKGMIVALHEYSLHSGIYETAYRCLAEAGYSVHTMDLRGHGRSSGGRGEIDDFEDYLDDLDLLIARVRDQSDSQPLFLLGLGLGSLIALRHATSRRSSSHGLILCGALPELPLGAKERFISRYAGPLLSQMPAGVDARAMLLKSDNGHQEAGDELIFRGPITAKTVAQINASNVFIQDAQEFLSFPVLCLADEHCRNLVQKLHDRLLTHDKTFQLCEDLDLRGLPEGGSNRLLGRIIRWCAERLEAVSEDQEENDLENDEL